MIAIGLLATIAPMKDKQRVILDAWKQVGEYYAPRRFDWQDIERPSLDPEANNIPFTWKGESAIPHETSVMMRAFVLAGRGQMIEDLGEEYLAGAYYITDLPQDVRNDSSSLENKYGDGARLEDQMPYYLCRQ